MSFPATTTLPQPFGRRIVFVRRLTEDGVTSNQVFCCHPQRQDPP
jgi:hypothetical protein